MHLGKKYILLIIAFHFLLMPDSISRQNQFEQLLIVTPKNSQSVVQNAITDLLQFLNSNKFYIIEISTDPTSFSQQTQKVIKASTDFNLTTSWNYVTFKTNLNLLPVRDLSMFELFSEQKNQSDFVLGKIDGARVPIRFHLK